MDCVFCKIVAGQIPAIRVYEDEHILAFMDIAPVVKGHVLVIPKAHYDLITVTPDAELASCMSVARQIAEAQIKGLKADGVNLHQANGAAAGQVVPHLHFHVIPRYHDDGHNWNWHGGSYDSTEMMQQVSDQIKRVMPSEMKGVPANV